MRIGFDLRLLQNPLTSAGLHQLVERAVPMLAEVLAPDHEIRALIDPAGRPVVDTIRALFGDRPVGVVDYPEPPMRRLAKLRDPVSAERERILDREVDVLCQFDLTLGVPRATPTVLLVSELAALLLGDRHPDRHRPTYRVARASGLHPTSAGYRAVTRWLFERHLDLGLRRATTLLVPAGRMRELLLDRWTGDPDELTDRIRIAAPGPHELDPGAGPNALDRARIRGLGLDRRPFLLFTGRSFEGARIDQLVAAHNHLRGRGRVFDLALVGDDLVTIESMVDRVAADEIAESSYRDDIHLLGPVRPELRHRLHATTVSAVLPGAFTGPVTDHVDTRILDTPVVLHDDPGFLEVTSSDRLVVPDRWEALADAMARRLDEADPDRRPPDAEEIASRSDRSWRDFASVIAAALVDAARSGPADG